MLRMRKMQWALLCLLSATMACAESAKDAINAFRDSMGKGQFVLRNFSGEDQVHALWTGTGLELDEPHWRTLGVLAIDSVNLNANRLMLKCIRHVVIKDKNDRTVLYADPRPVEIDVDLGSADPTDVLPKLKEALFFPSTEAALASIPERVRGSIPARIDKKPSVFSSKPKAQCDCADKGSPDCSPVPLQSTGMTPPRWVSGKDPEFTDEASRVRLNGFVDVAVTVDENGRPTDVWVIRPLGKGLDEAAAKSVLSYVFKPAMCHDKPVPVFLFVDVAL
jgi:TonB family protein